MRRKIRAIVLILLLTLVIFSSAENVEAQVSIRLDFENQKYDVTNDNLTFYLWFGPSQQPVHIVPTFAWQDNRQPSILYVADILGLYEFSEENSTVKDNAFQRNEIAQNGSFNWIGTTRWDLTNFTRTVSGVTTNTLNMTLNGVTLPSAISFGYHLGNLTFGATNYGNEAPNQGFYGYNYVATQARTDVFLNLTQWRWTANTTNNNLALMLGLYVLNATVIQNLGFSLKEYVVEDYNFLSPEGLRDKYFPFDPSAFLLTNMTLTAGNGATTSGGSFDLRKNETTLIPPLFEHKLNYSLPATTTTTLPFIRMQFASGNTTLAGYISFPGFAVSLDSNGNKKDTLNVTSSYISTGNYLRVFLSYPFFDVDKLRHFFSLGSDDQFLPPQPTPPSVYIVLPSISLTEAAIIAGIAALSIVAAVFSTRMVRRAGLETRR